MTQLRLVVVSLLLLAAVGVLYFGGLKPANLKPLYNNIAELNEVVRNLTQVEEIRNAWMRNYYTKQALERVEQLQHIGDTSGFQILYNVIVPEVQCPVMVRVGSIVDGGKFVCNPNAISEKNCRIYSLGINDEISFDQEIQKITRNRCRIYGYDNREQQKHTKDNYKKINGKLEVMHISESKGHRIEDLFDSNNDTFADILKIDVEGAEMTTLVPFLSNKKYRVCQILVEMHGSAKTHLKLLAGVAK
ncbi:hypothetical protein Aduo_006869 [Ancylostoma duodenale]